MKVSSPYKLRAQPNRLLYASNLYTCTFNAGLVIEMRINPERVLSISFL